MRSAKSILTATVLGWAMTGCSTSASPPEPVQSTSQAIQLREVQTTVPEPPDRTGVLYSATFQDGKVIATDATPFDPSSYGTVSEPLPKVEPSAPTAKRKVSTYLEAMADKAASEGRPNGSVEVVVTFVEDLRIPRFPAYDHDEDIDSAANQRTAASARQLVEDIKLARAPGYDKRVAELSERFGLVETERFWLSRSIAAQMPLSKVRELAQESDVQYVEPVKTDARPPSPDILTARSVMQVVNMKPLSWGRIRIVLIDSGVRTSHTLLQGSVYWAADCVNGNGTMCQNQIPHFPAMNPDDTCNHGTGAASITSGNVNLLPVHEGITFNQVHSLKVYDASTCTVNLAAAKRAFQAVAAGFPDIVVANVQLNETENSSLAADADAAFNTGKVVIAANGNSGPAAGSVRCPANARKVLGVGAADVDTKAIPSNSSRGPTGDGRTKPEVLGPTNVYAASTTTTTSLAIFGDTSGAAASVGGAAALLMGYTQGMGSTATPGQAYALLINSGRSQTGSVSNNTSGAGLFAAPVTGKSWWHTILLSNGTPFHNATFLVPAGMRYLVATAWWQEEIGGSHHTIYLDLLDPASNTVATSTVNNSVFQKVSYDLGYTTGAPYSWTARVRAISLPSGSRWVAGAITALPAPPPP